MDFEKAVITIGFTGKQALELQLGKALLERGQSVFGLLMGLLVPLFLGELGEADMIGQLLLQHVLTLNRSRQLIAFAHQSLCTIGVIP
jgi:hypothetical protein